MSRRKFLLSAALAASGLAFADWKFSGLRASRKNRLAFFTINSAAVVPRMGFVTGGEVALHIVDVTSGEHQAFSLPMETPHALIQHPFQKNIVVVAPREKSRALVFDISKGEVVASLDLDGGRYFYGHGVFSKNGERLLLTAFDRKSNGFLLDYDKAWRPVRHIETFGKAPHDIRLCQGGDAVLIANNGWSRWSSYLEPSRTSVVMMETASMKLIEKIELPEGHIAFQHLAENDRGDFLVGCDYYGPDRSTLGKYPSLLAYHRVGGPVDFFDMSVDMRVATVGNILSVAWDEGSGTVITTTPEGPVTLWSLPEMKATKQILMGRHPHGVAINENDLFVTTANSGVLWAARSSSEIENFARLRTSSLVNISAHATWLA